MRKITFNLLVLFISYQSFSQILNSDENGYYEVITLDSLSKKQIHNKAKEWIALNYKSANDVVQLDTNDKIIVKGVFNSIQYNYHHSLIMSFKDNGYRVELVLNTIQADGYSIVIDVENGYLTTSKEKIYELYDSYPFFQEGYIKKIFIEQCSLFGLDEKTALKEWERSRDTMLLMIPKKDELYYNQVIRNSEGIKEKINSIFKRIENYIKEE